MRTIDLHVAIPDLPGGKRRGGPGKISASASPGGKAMSRGSQLPAQFARGPLASANKWGRDLASWPVPADLIRDTDAVDRRKRTPVLRHLSAPDGRPIQAAVLVQADRKVPNI